jgi:hypothetical protein
MIPTLVTYLSLRYLIILFGSRFQACDISFVISFESYQVFFLICHFSVLYIIPFTERNFFRAKGQ